MLLPGLLCNRRLWEPQIDAFGRAAQILVADLAQDDTVAGMARRVLADAPDEFALAALSMGGYVAFEIMRQAPERVQRLALLDTSARPDRPEQSARRRGLMELAQKGRFKGVTPQLLPILIHPDRRSDQALVRTVMDMAEEIGMDAFLRQQQAIMGRPDSRPLLPAIACPTLVLCGADDQLTPLELHEEMAAGIPGARLVVVPECGHLSTLERPDAVNAALRAWLDE